MRGARRGAALYCASQMVRRSRLTRFAAIQSNLCACHQYFEVRTAALPSPVLTPFSTLTGEGRRPSLSLEVPVVKPCSLSRGPPSDSDGYGTRKDDELSRHPHQGIASQCLTRRGRKVTKYSGGCGGRSISRHFKTAHGTRPRKKEEEDEEAMSRSHNPVRWGAGPWCWVVMVGVLFSPHRGRTLRDRLLIGTIWTGPPWSWSRCGTRTTWKKYRPLQHTNTRGAKSEQQQAE